MAGGQCVQTVQLFNGNLPTRLALHRGRRDEISLLKCRRCFTSKEKGAHALNECPYSHDSICARHDAVVDKGIHKELSKRPELSVHKEVSVKVDMEGFRPDLVTFDQEEVKIVEVM